MAQCCSFFLVVFFQMCYLYVSNFLSCVIIITPKFEKRVKGWKFCQMAILPNLWHWAERQVLFVIVHQPWWALRYVIKSKCERDEKNERSNAKPVPSKGTAHKVADDNPESRHHLQRKIMIKDFVCLIVSAKGHLGKWATNVSHVSTGCLMYIDRRNCNLKPGSKTEQKPTQVELPWLRSCHEKGPTYEEAHHWEGQEGSFTTDSVHEKNSAEGSK